MRTGGIAYADLFFDATDADEDEIHYIRLFTDLMFEWRTESGSSTEFRNKTKQHLGAFYITPYPVKNGTDARLYLQLHASCLDGEKANAVSVINEYLYSTLYDDPEVLRKNLKQLYTYSLESLSARGDAFASMRSAARHSTFEAISEHLFGYEYHVFIKELSQNVGEKANEILERLNKISKKYFVRERLTLGLTEPSPEEYATALINTVRCTGESSGKTPVRMLEKINEGIAVPTTVSFTATGANLEEIGDGIFNGSFLILQSIASLELLWNEIRVKNGAYDTGFNVKPTGAIGCYSYRDPSPMASVEYFEHISNEINAFLDTSPELLKYIIGTFGASDNVSTPRSDGTLATKRHLAGKAHEDFMKRRRECLDTTLDELYRINGIIKDATKGSTFTVVGPRDLLEKEKGIERILDI
jgi:Zn-dependent M16 (insulinase) family peptidase